MKKLFVSLICVIMMASIFVIPNVKANEGVTANVTFSGITTENTVEISIKVGTFEGVETGGVVNASMTLAYDNDIVTSVETTGSQNWQTDFAEGTKRLLISTDNATENAEIAKIVFHLNTTNITDENNTISITEFQIASGEGLNETYPEYTYSITIEQENTNPDDETQPPIQDSEENTTITDQKQEINTIQADKQDTTVANQKLPATGLKNIVMIAVMGVIILAIIFKIKSRKIKY